MFVHESRKPFDNDTPAGRMTQAGINAAHGNNYAGAQDWFMQALKSEGADLLLLHDRLARTCLELKDWEGAINHARSALAVDPKDCFAHFFSAIAMVKMGDLEGAYQLMDDVLRQNFEEKTHRHMRGALGFQKLLTRAGIHRADFENNLHAAFDLGLIDRMAMRQLSEPEPDLTPEALSSGRVNTLKDHCGLIKGRYR